ncbi:cobyrinic acid a,c-diamide synthase [Shimia isoporae]|uniref:Hydrogenobyrinate a,c-diamide synthase n=1 Tax=Shimia isoporae TaxID=647720 RepID=A0A4R1NQR5_9RHOB|nr:cobyrinate a,c-diamide synthase [Shimia isoporae]TCL10199.1 cobyrinic acid a,c-diamide synthase [Shimia isoporae]
MTPPPGILISAPSSGTGKTTVMLGLLRALSEDGLKVQPFKSGPDYIDPAFHHAAARRAAYNLDTWAMPPDLAGGIAVQSEGAEIVVAEGSMGLFDGVATRGENGFGSSAETALMMGWPVVLVIDVGGQAQSAAATALGFKSYNPDLPFAGVILNRCASPRHERLARLGMDQAGINVLGVLPRRGDLTLPERHLGLIQAVEHPDLEEAIKGYADFLRKHVDLQAIKSAAKAGAPKTGSLPKPPAQRIALARDAAFSFTYPHLLTGWRNAGAEVLPFSPLADEPPAPDADLVWLPGGYPELHAGTLAGNTNYLSGLRQHAASKPVHGECGGYMALGKTLIDKDGHAHEMAGLLGLVTSYEKRKFHLGYRQATLLAPMLGFEAGSRLRGHEFHYTTILEEPDAPLAQVGDADGNAVPETGSIKGNVTGTFFHLIAEASKGQDK